jgi:SOS-response transcriptional repressor LexA
MSNILAQRLKVARKAIHPAITQKDIARHFNITAGSVSLWESGTTEPNSETLAELARTYKVSVDWLVGFNNDTPSTLKNNIQINMVPVVSSTALGLWRLNNPLDHLQTLTAYQDGTAAAIKVASDALSSECPIGCYAVVSKGAECIHGCIVLATVGDSNEPILRKLIKDGDDSLLIADDARWPTVSVSSGVRIIGSVTEISVKKLLK